MFVVVFSSINFLNDLLIESKDFFFVNVMFIIVIIMCYLREVILNI